VTGISSPYNIGTFISSTKCEGMGRKL